MRKRDDDHLMYLKSLGITKRDIQKVDLKKRESLRDLKTSFRLRYPILMTNILRLLLQKGEEKIACQLAAYYELSIDDEFLFYALEHRFYTILKFIWVYEKNFLGPRFSYDVDVLTGKEIYHP